MTWLDGAVIGRTDWADGLWTLRVDAVIDHEPGQFVNLALTIDGQQVKRAYSLASAPGAPAEFFLVRVEGGALTPALHRLAIGDHVQVQQEPQGFFVLSEVPDARDLWLVASGTGLGPFMAMLRSETIWRRFANVVLVHGARYASHLAYRAELEALSRTRPLRCIGAVTREAVAAPLLAGRITARLADGQLEATAGTVLSAEHSHVMLCGNPDMVTDVTAALIGRGLAKHRRRAPGHITIEKYW